jgi:hypothetical protein
LFSGIISDKTGKKKLLVFLPARIIFGIVYSYFDKIFPGFGGTVAFGTGG